jgi:hypothetical protein
VSLRAATLLALLALIAPGTAAAAPVAMNAEEFKLYKEYLGALGDERVQKLPENKRTSAIARNFKVSEKVLAAAIEKGARAGDAAGRDCEAEVRALADKAGIGVRVVEVKVDDTEPHVVTYLHWRNEESEKLEEEVSLLALLASEGSPIASTIALWATDKASGRKVFEAKISASAAAKFSRDRIPMFAATRYIRVFEDVKNAYKGTPPSESN